MAAAASPTSTQPLTIFRADSVAVSLKGKNGAWVCWSDRLSSRGLVLVSVPAEIIDFETRLAPLWLLWEVMLMLVLVMVVVLVLVVVDEEIRVLSGRNFHCEPIQECFCCPVQLSSAQRE